MRKILIILPVLALVIGTLAMTTGVIAIAPAPTCVEVDTEICVDNLPAGGGGVTGGDNDYCSNEPSEWDEWHFIINQLDPATEAGAPAYIIAEFQTAGDVQIDLEGVSGGAAHYRIKGDYLDDTLLDACGMLPAGSCYGNFVLSHAPCGTTTTTTTTTATTSEITEVGGTILLISKGWMIAPLIALAVAFVSVTAVIIWRRQAVK